jgi:hypothetical protein
MRMTVSMIDGDSTEGLELGESGNLLGISLETCPSNFCSTTRSNLTAEVARTWTVVGFEPMGRLFRTTPSPLQPIQTFQLCAAQYARNGPPAHRPRILRLS